MKTYFKILTITLIIQIAGFGTAYFTDELFLKYDTGTILPIVLFIGGILISTVLGIVLPIILGKSVRQKLLTIFLLPTNYTWLMIIILVIYISHHVVELFSI